MKTAIVYYSMSGNTAMTAEELVKHLDADLIEIRPVKQYPDKGIRKFLWGGKSAVMAETPELQEYSFPAEDYDLVILGFPVWAGNMAPPMRTFVRDNLEALKGKRIAAYACQSGNGADKAFGKLRECLDGAKPEATLVLVDPKRKRDPENEKRIVRFTRQLT